MDIHLSSSKVSNMAKEGIVVVKKWREGTPSQMYAVVSFDRKKGVLL